MKDEQFYLSLVDVLEFIRHCPSEYPQSFQLLTPNKWGLCSSREWAYRISHGYDRLSSARGTFDPVTCIDAGLLCGISISSTKAAIAGIERIVALPQAADLLRRAAQYIMETTKPQSGKLAEISRRIESKEVPAVAGKGDVSYFVSNWGGTDFPRAAFAVIFQFNAKNEMHIELCQEVLKLLPERLQDALKNALDNAAK